MGLFRDLFGKKDSSGQPGGFKISKPYPNYERINRWIESRIGKIDPNDPTLQTRLETLVSQEKENYPPIQGKLKLTLSGNDTLITGDTLPFKKRLKSMGCRWDASMQCWVARNKQLTEEDLDNPSELAGLEAYIKTIPYRKNLDNPGGS